MDELADRITDTILNGYRRLPSSGKPGTRANGVKEWTVLAGIVGIDEKNNKIRLISVGTGMKATPDVELHRSNGMIVHDCHAEIVSLRGFNAVLLKEMISIKEGHESVLLVKGSNGKFHLKENLSVAMYVSRLPCGDASMEFLRESDQNEFGDYNDMEDDHTNRQYINPEISTILRGRANYNMKGVVRTKPGRADSKLTLSKSCSDKLTLRQATSICNSMTWYMMEEPIFLKYLVLPKDYETSRIQLEKTFRQRLVNCSFTPFEFLFTDINFNDDKVSESEQPCLTCSSLLNSTEKCVTEVILNGVKNGSYVKGKKALRKGCQPSISRYAQWLDFKKIQNVPSVMDYISFKARLEDRQRLVAKAKSTLSNRGWINTFPDNCV